MGKCDDFIVVVDVLALFFVANPFWAVATIVIVLFSVCAVIITIIIMLLGSNYSKRNNMRFLN